MKISQKQQRQLQDYIDSIKPQMGLSNWRISVDRDCPPDGANAKVHFRRQVQTCQVLFSSGRLKESPEEVRETICHEMLHLVHSSQTEIIANSIDHIGGEKVASDLVWRLFCAETEIMVAHLAKLVAPTLPMPNISRG